MEINKNEIRILKVIFESGELGVSPYDVECIKVWRTKHYRSDMFRNMYAFGLIRKTESGRFIITEKGESVLGYNKRTKLVNYLEQ